MSNSGIYLPQRIIKSMGPAAPRGPPRKLVDWGILFNLFIFVTFLGSIFYVCLHRYRNKDYYRKQKEAKQRKMVADFQKILEEYQLNQQKKHYMEGINKKLQNQIQMSQSLDSLRGKLDLVYQNPQTSHQILLNNHNSFQARPHQSDSTYQTPFFNSSDMINYR